MTRPNEGSQPSPNVVVVLADQLRGMALGCAGDPDAATPTADRLAAEGTRFTNAVANSPVCGPSRASLLTGRYPLAHRVLANDLPLPEGIGTLGDLFGRAGYRTGYIGKWHLDGVPRDKWTPPGPRRRGFAYWAAYNCSHEYFRNEKYYADSATPVRVEGYEPVVQTDLAVRFINATAPPFLLFLSWGPPHDPYPQVPQAYRDRYDPTHVHLRPNVALGDRDPAHERAVRRSTADYYAAVTALDDQLARVLSALDERGIERDTIVIYTSDHGDMLWSHGRTQKQAPWEESISIPFLIRWPGVIPAGALRHDLLGIVDVAPTIATLCGLPGPAQGVQGRDRSAAVKGAADADMEDAALLMNVMPGETPYREGIREWRGVRTHRYTYARSLDGDPWLLYDNHEDPYQLTNLAGNQRCKGIVERLDATLTQLLTATEDPFISGEEQITRFGLDELWNERERELNPDCPRLL